MTVAAVSRGVVERAADLLAVAIDKARQSCFIDVVVGLLLILYYSVLQPPDLWPLIWALGITRSGDAIKSVASSIWGRANA